MFEPSKQTFALLQHIVLYYLVLNVIMYALIQKAVALELKENQLDQERLLMTKITYGEKVQLLHTLTKKYLCVDTTKTSRTENKNLRVGFQPCLYVLLECFDIFFYSY